MRTGAGVFDVSHMGEIETSGPRRRALPPAAPLERRHEDRRGRRAVLGALPRGRRRARRPLHLPPGGGPLPDRHERLEPREGPRLVPRARRAASTSRSRTRTTTTRCSPSRARRRAERSSGIARRASCPRACATAELERRRRRLHRLRHGLHRRGRRRAADPARRRDRRLGRADRGGRDAGRPRRARHAAARGLLPPLRQRPLRGPQPDRGRPRLVLQARHGLHRRRRAARPRARRHARAVRLHRPRHPAARATRCARHGDGVVTSGTLSPCLELRHRHGVRSRGARPSPARTIEVDVRGKPRAAEVREKPLYQKETSG